MFKRFLSIFLSVALLVLPVHPVLVQDVQAEGIYLPVASGTVTAADMKLSTVDTVAHADFGAANVLTLKAGHLLVIKDDADRKLQGFIKLAGTAQTEGDELVTGWTNSVAHPYETLTTTGKDIDSAINTAAGTGIGLTGTNQLDAAGTGKLFKLVFTETLNSGAAPWLSLATDGEGAGGTWSAATLTANGANTFYQTSKAASTYAVIFNNATETNFSAVVSGKQVLTPSATGVTIAATKALAGTLAGAESWAQKDASFNYASANFTYEIYRVLDAPVVATHNLAAGELQADMTTASAMSQATGVDFTALGYQTGEYIFTGYDATVKLAAAYISATDPGGEVAPTELYVDPGFDDSTKWSNIGVGWTVDSGGNGKAIGSAADIGTKVSDTSPTIVVGGLYKHIITPSAYTSGGWRHHLANASYGVVRTDGSSNTYYHTFPNGGGAYGVIAAGSALTAEFSDISLRRLTDVATTGALLLSTQGGSRGWLKQEAGFNPNGAVTLKVLYAGAQ